MRIDGPPLRHDHRCDAVRYRLEQRPGSAARADFPGYGMLENTGATPAGQASVFTFSDAGIAGFYDNGALGDAHGADGVGRLVGAELKSAMSDVDRLLSIAVLTDDDVEKQNRVTLATTSDEHGQIPRVEIHQRNRSKRTKENREYLVEQAVRLLRAAGASKVYRINTPPWLYHIHSTMRMGLSKDDSVLDENAEARWVKRLFIADNSALANAIGGPNPTLTTQALATRTAEKIFQLYFGGDLGGGGDTGLINRSSRHTGSHEPPACVDTDEEQEHHLAYVHPVTDVVGGVCACNTSSAAKSHLSVFFTS